MHVLQPNQRLGEFQIVRLLGKGGMGQVYEAQQLNPPRPVALKVLAPWLAENEDALQRFWREAAVLAKLDHPSIVRIISTGQTPDGTAYYAMHLVQGISLADLVRRSRDPLRETSDVPTTPAGDSAAAGKVMAGVFPAGEAPPTVLADYRSDPCRFAAIIGAAAARALAHAHQQGFLHRDIKPSNLMIDHRDQLYLVDFGLTRALDPGASGTQGVAIRGTPWYMSPEQARGEPLDERSDIYSLGVTLYELVTQGEGPFTASRENSDAVLAQVRAGQALPLRMLAPAVPWKLEQLILRAMNYRPQRRYQSAAALAEDLAQIANQTASTLSRSKPWHVGLQRFVKPAWLSGAALLLLLLIGTAAWRFGFFSGSAEPSPDPGERQAPPKGEPPSAVSLKEVFQRERPLNVQLPLLRADFQPVKERVLSGEGRYISASELVLHSPPDNKPTVIGLDYLESAFFEFSIELRQADTRVPNQNDLGIVFGWHDRAPDPLSMMRCFNVQLDERPVLADHHGRVTIGTGQWMERKGARGALFQLLAPLPQGRGMLPLGKPLAGPGAWHKLRVRVTGNRIRVTVDDRPAEEIDMAWLVNADRRLKNVYLKPSGALGIWVRNGVGFFRNATIMALPE